MKTRRYVGKREEKITTEYEKRVSLLCFVNEFPNKIYNIHIVAQYYVNEYMESQLCIEFT